MKLLMLMADGYEDVEATTTMDVLMRGKQEVIRASLMKTTEVVSKCQCRVLCDCRIDEVKDLEYDGLIIPGGPGSFRIMPALPVVSELIKKYADSGKLVASICAAPHLVGKLGYFKNRKYTVHPGFEDMIKGGVYLRDSGVVVDGNFITAKSMYYSFDFGLAIYEYFYGKNAALALEKSCRGE